MKMIYDHQRSGLLHFGLL